MTRNEPFQGLPAPHPFPSFKFFITGTSYTLNTRSQGVVYYSQKVDFPYTVCILTAMSIKLRFEKGSLATQVILTDDALRPLLEIVAEYQSDEPSSAAPD